MIKSNEIVININEEHKSIYVEDIKLSADKSSANVGESIRLVVNIKLSDAIPSGYVGEAYFDLKCRGNCRKTLYRITMRAYEGENGVSRGIYVRFDNPGTYTLWLEGDENVVLRSIGGEGH